MSGYKKLFLVLGLTIVNLVFIGRGILKSAEAEEKMVKEQVVQKEQVVEQKEQQVVEKEQVEEKKEEKKEKSEKVEDDYVSPEEQENAAYEDELEDPNYKRKYGLNKYTQSFTNEDLDECKIYMYYLFEVDKSVKNPFKDLDPDKVRFYRDAMEFLNKNGSMEDRRRYVIENILSKIKYGTQTVIDERVINAIQNGSWIDNYDMNKLAKYFRDYNKKLREDAKRPTNLPDVGDDWGELSESAHAERKIMNPEY